MFLEIGIGQQDADDDAGPFEWSARFTTNYEVVGSNLHFNLGNISKWIKFGIGSTQSPEDNWSFTRLGRM